MSLTTNIKSAWLEADSNQKIALVIIGLWVMVALLAPILAPFEYDKILGGNSSLLPPMGTSTAGLHLLGTDTLGRDVTSGMIHGARVSFIVCLLVISSSLVIGLLIGTVMGYFGDRGIKFNFIQLLWLAACIFFITYYKLDVLFHGLTKWSAFMVLLFTILVFSGLYMLDKLNLKKYNFPVDVIWQRVFEVKESLPNLFIILAIAAIIAKPSLWTLSFTLIILYWVTFARYARIEMMRVKEEDYIMAAKAEGVSTYQLITKHALPNIMGPLLVVIAFSLSGVILIESSLSFLGIGLPLQEVTWGKLLAEARKSSSAWWLALFPGLAIFALIYAFNTLADMIRSRTN